MIHLSEDDIIDFQALYQQETGQKIDREKAAEYAERLVQLMEWVTAEETDPLRQAEISSRSTVFCQPEPLTPAR